MIDQRSGLNLCASYDNFIKTTTAKLILLVADTKDEHNSVYVPPNIVKGRPLHFAIEDIVFENDTTGGKNEFHGTAHVILQKGMENTRQLPITINKNGAVKFKGGVLQEKKIEKSLFQNESYSTFSGEVLCTQFNSCYKIGQTWALCQVVNEDIIVILPT